MAKSNINCLILEDAYYTASELCKYLNVLRPDFEVIVVADSIMEADKLIRQRHCDLILCDTEVSDGSTIEYLNNKEITTPIIFFSGYELDNKTVEKLSVIDLIMLPVSFSALKKALEKYNDF